MFPVCHSPDDDGRWFLHVNRPAVWAIPWREDQCARLIIIVMARPIIIVMAGPIIIVMAGPIIIVMARPIIIVLARSIIIVMARPIIIVMARLVPARYPQVCIGQSSIGGRHLLN